MNGKNGKKINTFKAVRIPGKLISQSGANWSVIPVQNDQRSERSDAGQPL
jgi:hypothetical protein